MRVYISGPMTGLPDLNYPAFRTEATLWRANGHEAVNPAELEGPDDEAWEWYLKRDLKALLDCDAVVLLPGWEASRGANLEVHVARALGMEVIEP